MAWKKSSTTKILYFVVERRKEMKAFGFGYENKKKERDF
jgi:hypothetical protein